MQLTTITLKTLAAAAQIIQDTDAAEVMLTAENCDARAILNERLAAIAGADLVGRHNLSTRRIRLEITKHEAMYALYFYASCLHGNGIGDMPTALNDINGRLANYEMRAKFYAASLLETINA